MAHHSVYDVLYKRPKLHRKLAADQEKLARALVDSGKLRIDAGSESNFTRLLIPNDRLDMTFTLRELTTPALISAARAKINFALQRRHNQPEALAAQYFDKALTEVKKRVPVSPQTELMIARALVLCNAQPVIELLHLEGAEFFISFGQSVGDVMDIARWEQMGENSGLQAVGGGENAVYVSCGGHPFLSDDERTYTSDGFPALARLMIIAAQETGHNGDMRRDDNGRWAGRYSAEHWSRAPSKVAGEGRRADIAHMEKLHRSCRRMGLARVARFEEHVQFYRRQKLYHLRHLIAWLLSRIGWQVIKYTLRLRGLGGLTSLQRSPDPCTQLEVFFQDMLANLTPVADVYRRNNPLEEEAVACIEAVARVPQQVVKWGDRAVRFSTPALHRFYYGVIVPVCLEAIKKRKRS